MEKRVFAIFITFIGTGLRLTELYSLNFKISISIRVVFSLHAKAIKKPTFTLNSEVATAIQDYFKNERQR